MPEDHACFWSDQPALYSAVPRRCRRFYLLGQLALMVMHICNAKQGKPQTASDPLTGARRRLADFVEVIGSGLLKAMPLTSCFPLSDPCFWVPHIFTKYIYQAEKMVATWLPLNVSPLFTSLILWLLFSSSLCVREMAGSLNWNSWMCAV